MKPTLKIIGSLVLFGIIGFAGYKFGYPYYEKKTWEPPVGIYPAKIGDLRKDVFFKKTMMFRCEVEGEEIRTVMKCGSGLIFNGGKLMENQTTLILVILDSKKIG